MQSLTNTKTFGKSAEHSRSTSFSVPKDLFDFYYTDLITSADFIAVCKYLYLMNEKEGE